MNKKLGVKIMLGFVVMFLKENCSVYFKERISDFGCRNCIKFREFMGSLLFLFI